MATYTFYEPFYFEIERLLNDPSVSKQDRKAGCNGARCAPVVRSFKPRYTHINHLRFLYFDTEYRLDVHEDIAKNVVTATFEFPGLSNDEVQINFQNGKLTVSAETKKSEDHADTGYTLRERLHGRLSRTLQLPESVQVCSSSLNIFGWLLTEVYIICAG